MKKIKQIIKSIATSDGAGVKLNRVFGYHEVPLFDPFLMLDHFKSANPNDYMAGFPWHPHRGIETVTYMLNGSVEHKDSLGNEGVISAGDVQWMTAGSGIIHQEMPKTSETVIEGFQLWVNLPASHKMMNPRYQEVKKAEIPEIIYGENIKIRIICGEVNGVRGPVEDITACPSYLDVIVPANTSFQFNIAEGINVFAYVYSGNGIFAKDKKAIEKEVVLFENGGEDVIIESGENELKFLLVFGKPINEPVAWHGPIVMNTNKELDVAFIEYQEGTFIKK